MTQQQNDDTTNILRDAFEVASENEKTDKAQFLEINKSLRDSVNFSLLLLGGVLTIVSIDNSGHPLIRSRPLFFVSSVLFLCSLLYSLIAKEVILRFLLGRTMFIRNWNAKFLSYINRLEERSPVDLSDELKHAPKMSRFFQSATLIASSLLFIGILLLFLSLILRITV